MINIEKESLQRKYCSQLTALRKFNVWTLEQIKGNLHIDHSTVKKFVANELLYEFKISRCSFYSSRNEYYTNSAIIKSILDIDLNYLIKNNLEPCVPVSDKTLISRNVTKLGYLDGVSYYSVSYLYPLVTTKDFMKIEKLLIDIQAYADTDSVSVFITFPEVDSEELKKYLLNSSKIIPYLTANLINVRFIANEHKCFKYVKM